MYTDALKTVSYTIINIVSNSGVNKSTNRFSFLSASTLCLISIGIVYLMSLYPARYACTHQT